MLSVIMLSGIYTVWHNAECHYTECRGAFCKELQHKENHPVFTLMYIS